MFDSVIATLHIEPIDRDEAKKVLDDPEIYDKISSDESPESFEWPDIEYSGGYVDGELASVNICQPFRDGTKVHFQCLKAYRWAARELLDMHLPKGRLYCEIPKCFMSTINFAKKAGFEVIEIKPKIYPKYGKLHDRYVMRLDHERSH